MRVTTSPHVLLILSLSVEIVPFDHCRGLGTDELKMILAAKNTQRFALTTEGMEINGADLISTP